MIETLATAFCGAYIALFAQHMYKCYKHDVEMDREEMEEARRGFKGKAHAKQDEHFKMMLEEMK